MPRKLSEIFKKKFNIFPIKVFDIIATAKSLSVMLGAGLTVVAALEILVEQNNDPLKSVLKRVADRVKAGQTFSNSLKSERKIFNSVFISSVEVGERTGTLAQDLERLSVQLERDFTVRNNLKSAMVYPVLVLSIMLVVGFGVAKFVLPKFADTVGSFGTKLPWSTRVVISLAVFFENYGTIFILFFLVLVISAVFLFRQPFTRRFVQPLLLKIPVLNGFIHDANRAILCRSLGTLLDSGIPIQEAFKILENTSFNYVYRQAIKNIELKIAAGQRLKDLLAAYPALFSKMFQNMIGIGESSGEMSKVLFFLAKYFEEKIDVRSKNFSAVFEPVLLLAAGLGVLFLALAVILPIYNITSLVAG
jgi:type II secretory pathway component PulF